MTTTVAPTDLVRQDTIQAWRSYEIPATCGALLGDWAVDRAADGLPLLTATVAGQHAELALRRFGAAQGLTLTDAGDQKPVLAYAGCYVTVTWRTNGVWVQLATA